MVTQMCGSAQMGLSLNSTHASCSHCFPPHRGNYDVSQTIALEMDLCSAHGTPEDSCWLQQASRCVMGVCIDMPHPVSPPSHHTQRQVLILDRQANMVDSVKLPQEDAQYDARLASTLQLEVCVCVFGWRGIFINTNNTQANKDKQIHTHTSYSHPVGCIRGGVGCPAP